jgi:Protein phosphatase 2C
MASAFPLRWQAFRQAKHGNAADDYEDAGIGDGVRGRFAVADGASEASFAGIWAKMLVDGFIHHPETPWRDLDWVVPLRQKWAAAVDDLPLPWYAEEKRQLGAFATFLGLAFRHDAGKQHGHWRAIAVGDCGVFHTRGGRLLQAFPLTKSAEFGNRPDLLRSRGDTIAKHELAHGRWQAQDRFLLMTDALAQWFLLCLEQHHDPLAEISSLVTEADVNFSDWLAERRSQAMLRNDDATLLVVDVD